MAAPRQVQPRSEQRRITTVSWNPPESRGIIKQPLRLRQEAVLVAIVSRFSRPGGTATLKSNGNPDRDPPGNYSRIRRSPAARLHVMVARDRALLSSACARGGRDR